MPASYFSHLFERALEHLPWLRITRPRFWPYLAGPFVIGVVAANTRLPVSPGIGLILAGLYFTYPANYVIYAVNDVFDYETDKHNPKKQRYEMLVGPERRSAVLWRAAGWLAIGYGLLAVLGATAPAYGALSGFYFFGILYSAPPVRAKTKPLLDSVFNVLYIFPAFVGYYLAADGRPLPVDWRLFAAATVWCMAMHAYSAVPDIMADGTAGIGTVATWLGSRGTLLFCLVCYLAAAVLSAPVLGWFSLMCGVLYATIVGLSLAKPGREHVFRLYRFFPYVNMAVGMALFFWIALVVRGNGVGGS